MCKVKGFEKNHAKIVAVGSHAEMNQKLDEMDKTVEESENGWGEQEASTEKKTGKQASEE